MKTNFYKVLEKWGPWVVIVIVILLACCFASCTRKQTYPILLESDTVVVAEREADSIAYYETLCRYYAENGDVENALLAYEIAEIKKILRDFFDE